MELLNPPEGSSPGDKVTVENFTDGQPDEVLNPKKKVWEKLQVYFYYQFRQLEMTPNSQQILAKQGLEAPFGSLGSRE